MKVHLIRKETIENYIIRNPNSNIFFENWLEKIKNSDWEKPLDMKQTFASVDLLGKHSKRAVFDIGGNNYRMICKCAFGIKQIHLFICWIGTHSEYDSICRAGDQYTVKLY
jgi:mRNA interferase HigB